MVLQVVPVVHAQVHLGRSDEFLRRCDSAVGSWADLCTCPCRKLHPAILMMKSAEDRPRVDVTDPSNWTNKRRVLGQRQMCPDTVVVGGIGVEDLTQVGLAKDHDVIQAFSTDRANQPLRMPILPG